ncbi:MAG: cobalamin biosynthesis protein [Magnetococcales bacterium]|nr:cobalamin biosynthesis protein [Magnetococcales bacterium]HIJ83620.1 cobalamin biosynthesis protein CobD [Magnetococcales bacterium]
MLLFSGTCLTLVGLAWLLDRWLGEPQRFHPLVGFGQVAMALENGIRRRFSVSGFQGRLLGLIAVVFLVGPGLVLVVWVSLIPGWGLLWQVLLLYLALGGKSLEQHALRVCQALECGDLAESRRRVGYMVSRDTQAMETPDVARATVESVLENGCDALFATLFWFILFGGPGAVLFRLANTLDAMWGYRNERYLYFGWCAARLDDVLGYVPARLTAVTYLVFGHARGAIEGWKRCTQRKSPNATLVMAVGGGALGLRLGGGGYYHGQWQASPVLGGSQPPGPGDIRRAMRLVRQGGMAWAIVCFLLGLGSLL